ncbi:Putative disease resistance protein RGA3 [Triticum urartu]|uniref:Putative disease resistance protein RGA3 n=1 Tax=Triticum urartu TaxID=4572 RepID=M7ZKX3_TRIUA|nr:Putative disease resistance protein RGA3 [Triticum urartu]
MTTNQTLMLLTLSWTEKNMGLGFHVPLLGLVSPWTYPVGFQFKQETYQQLRPLDPVQYNGGTPRVTTLSAAAADQLPYQVLHARVHKHSAPCLCCSFTNTAYSCVGDREQELEAMVGVGDMIASAVVKQVTSRLIKIAGDEIALQWKFKGDVDKMVDKMKDLEAVMHDADNKVSQGGDVGKKVGRWLLKLKSVAYDVEDLLDDLDTKNNEAKLKAFFSWDNPAYRWITRPHNLLDVRKRIEEIENYGREFKLVPQEKVERSRKNESFAPSSDRGTSTRMQGRSVEKDKLVNLILRSEANVHISIIPIVGLGGIGKTTLAQSVFADKRVDIFDVRAWVHVSEKFDLLQITRAIIKSIDANINLNNDTLQYLQDCLEDKLADKKYLIVLDDFWEEGGDNLEKLKLMLQHGSSGSRIIVTTRNQTVVNKMKTGVLAHQRVILPVQECDQINLGFLSTDDCWELIKIRAFRSDDDQTHLEKIGYEIASKCGGVPLVVNAFGHVMSENRSNKAWQDIKLKMADVGFRGTCQNDTLESLKLSYYYMKREFKICFAYLVAFPKGFLIDTNRLIQQWYALGYIYSEHDGENCINYLLGMSFLQISGHPTLAIMTVKLPRVTYEVAFEENLKQLWCHGKATCVLYLHKLRYMDLSGNRSLDKLPTSLGCSKITNLPDNLTLESLEHMNLSNCHELENLPEDFGNLQRLGFLSLSDCYKVSLLPESFCQLIDLKFLDLSDCHELMELPECFGHLFELDSLNLTSCCKLQVLPESFCKLSKLRCLNLSYCMRLVNLPTSFGDLKLQSLDISSTMYLTLLPDNIANMASLTQLEAMGGPSEVVDSVKEIKKHLIFPEIIEHDVHQIENNGYCSIVELAQLTCYEMRVQKLQNVSHLDAERAKLRDKSDLRKLTLCWGPQAGEGTCDTLPPFGLLPNLRTISMEKMPKISKMGKEFFGLGRTCTKLRCIHLNSMENLAELWTTRSGEENGEFLIPNLHNLSVENCPKLKFLPYPPRSIIWYLENIDEIIPEGGFGKLSSSSVPFQMEIHNCNFSADNWDRLHHISTLELLTVGSCNGLKALPEVIRCFTSLKELTLQSLNELESLPKWLGCLISLQRVFIRDCPSITSFPESMKNLTALEVLDLEGCKGCDILPEWIGHLTSLQEIRITDFSNLTSLPESMKDLTSLTKLSINNCPNLTSLPESMKGLTSLTELWIEECQGLAVLPEWLGQFTSLQEFNIINCPNLTSLPQSIRNLLVLKELYIWGCPILVERCQGEDADLISHIPEVTLHYEPEE